jgi:hypothetical protein
MAFPGYLLFFSMLFIPSAYQPFKAILGILVLGIIAIDVLIRGRLALHRIVLLWTLFMVTLGSAFIFLGFLNDAPGALRMSTVYVLWPLVFTVFIAGASKEKILRGLLVILVSTTIVIGLYGLSFILHAAGWLPDSLYIPFDQGQQIGFYQGYIEFILHSVSSLFFLVPYVIAALMTWPRGQSMPVSRLWLWIAFGFGMLLVLLSARRVLLGVVALSPAIALCTQQFLPTSMRWVRTALGVRSFVYGAIFLAGLLIYLSVVYEFNMLSLAKTFAVGWDFSAEQSALERREQFFPLLQGWAERPFFGAGHGASAEGAIRSHEMPWAYELTYLALLFHTGIVGFIAYAAGVCWIYWMSLKMIRLGNRLSLYMIPLVVGCTSFLIGNATNPYLEKYDYIWVIFLPVAFINFWLVNNSRTVPQTQP